MLCIETQALVWIVGFLGSNNIPYLIYGGLAAMVYGTSRALNVFDLLDPDSRYHVVIEFGQEFISFGPQRLQDQN